MAQHDRRQFLKVAGTAAAGALTGLAGCSGSGGDGGSGGGGGGGGTEGGTTSTKSGGEGPVTVGLLFPLSGPIAASGKEAVQGSKIAIERINENGGFAGRQVELVTADTKASPDTGVKRARQLIQQEDADILIGAVSSAVTKAINQFASSQNVPLMNTGSATPDIVQKECKKTTFRINANLIHQQRATAQQMLKMGGETKVAGVEPDYVYGKQSWEVFKEYYGSKVDLNIVSERFPAFMKGDYSKTIQATLDADPNVVHSSLYSGDMVSFIKQAKQFDFFDQIDYFVAGVVPMEVTAALGSDMPDNCIAAASSYFQFPEDNQQLQEFSKQYVDNYSEVPTVFSLDTATGWDVLKAAADKAGTVDTDPFVDAMEGISVDSVKEITMRAEDHQGISPAMPAGKLAPIDSKYADLYGHDELYGFGDINAIGKEKYAPGPTGCSF